MRALILAAGLGSRLAPITNSIPKSLVEVGGEPIVFRQIRCLQAAGVDDITLVAGYLAETMRNRVNSVFTNINVVVNDEYETTNNMFSAYLGLESMGDSPDSLLMMNADVFFDYSVIDALVRHPAPNAVIVDLGCYMEESMKVTQDEDGRLTHISKAISKQDAVGCSIDVYKLSREGVTAFKTTCSELLNDDGERNLWNEVALDRAFAAVRFDICPLEGRWLEVDNHDDLAAAELLFR